jgi:HAD superfamily hydrolase (TIGR01509 family)
MKDFGVYDEEAYFDACRVYEEVKLKTVTAFEGVQTTLDTIRKAGISVGIITDADTLHATSRLDRIGVLQMVDCLITPDRAGARKPDPRGFVLATETLEVSPESVCVVGDSLRREIEPAMRLGMTTVYARYGDRSNTKSPVVPDYTIMAFPELLPILGLEKE